MDGFWTDLLFMDTHWSIILPSINNSLLVIRLNVEDDTSQGEASASSHTRLQGVYEDAREKHALYTSR